MVNVPDITVRCDDSLHKTRVHALHNNLVRPATVPGLHAILAERFDELAADQGADFRELAADWMRTYASSSRTKNTYSRTRRELAANLCISVRGLART